MVAPGERATNDISVRTGIPFPALKTTLVGRVRYAPCANLVTPGPTVCENPHMLRIAVGKRRLTPIAISVALVALAVWVGGRVAGADAEAELRQRAQAALALDLALLDSELQRHRATPVILATEEPLRTLLQRPDENARAVVNARLEALARQTGAAAIYVTDGRGKALAASNYRGPASFVGSDYAFRPYFRDAMRQGAAEFFGQGTVSREPGLYISRRIDGPDGPLGVVVAKVQFQAVESAWRRQDGEVVVAERHGVILLASAAERRFSTLSPLSEPLRRQLMETRQFGEAPLRWTGASVSPPDRLEIGGARLLISQTAIGTAGWRLQVWTPMKPVEARQAVGRWLGLLGSTLLLLAGAALRAMMLRSQRRAEADSDARRLLEDKVGQRTLALTEANDRLSREVTERREAETRLRRLQADLVQANRLAQMGQTMAGVAHEINQPVAAIRANADNALILLDRREEAEARAKPGPHTDADRAHRRHHRKPARPGSQVACERASGAGVRGDRGRRPAAGQPRPRGSSDGHRRGPGHARPCRPGAPGAGVDQPLAERL